MRLPELPDQVVQIAFQRFGMVELQFLADVLPLVVEGLFVVVSEDLADAGRFQADREHPAKGDFARGKRGTDLLQPGEQPRCAEVGDGREVVLDGAPLPAGGREDPVEALGQEIVVGSALRGGVGDVDQQVDQDPDGRTGPPVCGGGQGQESL